MDRSLKRRSLTRSSLKIEESEKIDVCSDAMASSTSSTSFNGNGNDESSDMNNIRTNESVILVSDDEDFAGFGVCNNEQESPKQPKIKEEPLSDTEAVEFGGFDVKLEVKTEVMDEPHQINSKQLHPTTSLAQQKRFPCDITDEKYKKPFEFGWKRELVYRSQMADTRTKSDKAEVYYITPAGKKLRTKNEIQLFLEDGLDVNMFTFTKEPIGAGPDDEIVRSAKAYTPHTQRKVPNFLDIGEPDPTLGFGKRVPKPKMPKGVSPPPSNRNSVPAGSNSRKASEPPSDVDKIVKTPKSSKLKGEPCSIQCVLAMGTIPQLQCKKCLCLFHPECVGLHNYKETINHYICDNCIYELKALTNSQPEVPANIESHYVEKVSSLQPASSKLPTSHSNTNSNEKMIKRQSMNIQPDSAISRSNDNKESKSVIGGLTTWVPPTANLISNRSQLDISVSPPQSIAIVAGRKYIMVPKTNLMSVSPDGSVKIGDNNGIPLDYVAGGEERSIQNSSQLTTGEDSSPPAKKRMLSRSSSKVQTPASSPTHSPGAVAPSSTINFAMESVKSKRNNITSVEPSVHTMFASNFLSNVSIGYDVLLHTFQYLKVQELLRASCVCRMWNQVASNSFLWRTVRMKNSQVNDWSGLANTLKRNGTKHLDLRKMLIAGDTEQTWQQFASNIGKVVNLECIDLCRCSASVVVGLFETNPGLRILNAVAIKGEHLDMDNLSNLTELRELRLRSLSTLTLSNLKSLEGLVHLTHLSLTSANLSEIDNLQAIGKLVNLESLELGECSKLTTSFAVSLKWLQRLEKLRLEKGTDHCCTFDILDIISTLPNLTQLELVNFDIKSDFDIHLKRCGNIKRLLIIPTYISQSATTNNVILNGILNLVGHLEQLTWVVTLELLRVTELYVDQCDVSPRDRRQVEDKIPVLKPVPGLAEEDQQNELNADVPQVEILSLNKVENILSKHLPNLRYSILKVPYSATWRQTMLEV